MFRATRAVPGLALAFWLAGFASAAGEEYARLQGAEAEQFLRTAKVIKKEEIPVGVTHPQRLTLTDGARTARAAWKTVDIYRPIMQFDDGTLELGFRDNYRHEIAAYELDKLLGLGMVPPTVDRRMRGSRGSLQLWIEDAMTEKERMEQGLTPPDPGHWSRQIYTARLIRQLCDDSDFNNVGNVLVGADFRVWVIDHSRAFRLGKKLLAEGDLTQFSRSLLARLRRLDRPSLDAALGKWLTRRQIETLLLRRDLILARAARLVAERGEDAVLYR